MNVELLLLNLTLLGAVKPQEDVFNMTVLPTSPPSKLVPVQSYFRDEKFQGKWYIIAKADSRIHNGNQENLTMPSITYWLMEDRSLVGNTTMPSALGCDHWTSVFLSTTSPANFMQDTISGYPERRRILMRVAHTDYIQFAIVSFMERTQDKVYFYLTLYGRSKKLGFRLKRHFVKFANYHGFTEKNIIFYIPTGTIWLLHGPHNDE
nr:neutrophil gelatinase-associated lipocalin-like [Cavia porcellus]